MQLKSLSKCSGTRKNLSNIFENYENGRCNLCETKSRYISNALGVCLKCIRENPAEALALAMLAHKKSRTEFGLPETPPKDPKGISCNICVNKCRIPDNGIGYCGLRKNSNNMIVGVSTEKGKLSWYLDSLPTNCVGNWVCPGGTGAGYPEYACKPRPETGHKNMAVFFQACSFNCLFCQNWHFKHDTLKPGTRVIGDLISDIDDKTSCICYFGGDPSPQILFSLKASKSALEENRGRILRICWETNGSMNKKYLDQMLEIAMASGGCIKFDLKAWDENLHIALTGTTNKRTFENWELCCIR